MKSILVTTVLVLCSFNAFAGPEEHIAAQTCYALLTPAPKAIPERVCVEEISLNHADTTHASLNIYSYFNQRYFENMQLTYVARYNENGFSYRATSVLVDVYESGCGSAEKATLQISGRADNYGMGFPEQLEVSAKYDTLVDTCHSKLQTRIYNYIKE